MSRLRLLVPLVVMALAACGSDQTGPGPDTLTGTYHAVTVDDEPLPHALGSGSTLLSYTITVRADRTYDLAFSKRFADNSVTNVTDNGTYAYTASSGELDFTGQIPGVLHSIVSGGGSTLTLSRVDLGGYTVVLTR